MPTVAAIAAYPAIAPKRERAALKPSARVGSPPSSRIIAALTSAQLQKMIAKYWQK
ncbi:hypothetical protein D3C87_2150540 [compost metagenome]